MELHTLADTLGATLHVWSTRPPWVQTGVGSGTIVGANWSGYQNHHGRKLE